MPAEAFCWERWEERLGRGYDEHAHSNALDMLKNKIMLLSRLSKIWGKALCAVQRSSSSCSEKRHGHEWSHQQRHLRGLGSGDRTNRCVSELHTCTGAFSALRPVHSLCSCNMSVEEMRSLFGSPQLYELLKLIFESAYCLYADGNRLQGRVYGWWYCWVTSFQGAWRYERNRHYQVCCPLAGHLCRTRDKSSNGGIHTANVRQRGSAPRV